MRILHTSDWHLGRLFHQVHLTEDQAHVLEEFVTLAREEKPDAIVIAGDLYDRAVPPPEAVELLDDVLTRLTLDLGIPTLAIAGNHDSAERVGFAGKLLAKRGLYLVGTVAQQGAITLADVHGEVDFVALPYASPEAVRSALRDDAVRGHEQALAAQLAQVAGSATPGRRRVAIAHACVEGASHSESERPLTVGGTGCVSAALFEGFDYVALGHLHRPQQVDAKARYAGSLLPYSFSEVDHSKSVSMVELSADGSVSVEEIALSPRRVMRVIEGAFDDLLMHPASDDYVLARLSDREPILDAMARLRRVYPNALQIERPALSRGADGPLPAGQDHRKVEPLDLFETFYQHVAGEPLNEEQRQEVGSAIEEATR